MRRGIALVLAAALCADVLAQPKSDWERETDDKYWQEGGFQLPAYPRQENLVEFEVTAANGFRFFIDAASLSAGSDGVVRYTMVARSSSGAESVSFEGIRCKNAGHRIYATGRPADKSWSAARATDWKDIQARGASRPLQALRREYFCPQSVPISTREEGIAALKRGEHPHSGSTRPEGGRP